MLLELIRLSLSAPDQNIWSVEDPPKRNSLHDCPEEAAAVSGYRFHGVLPSIQISSFENFRLRIYHGAGVADVMVEQQKASTD